MIEDSFALGMRTAPIGRRYILTGDITLSYERYETDDTYTRTIFTQRYRINLRGYAIHPRLITFNLGSSFSMESGSGREGRYLFNGIVVNILPYKPLNYSLRYSRSDTDSGSDYQNYGLTITYNKPLRFKGRGLNKNKNNNRGFFYQIFPQVSVLDLDLIEHKESRTMTASLRTKGSYKKTLYFFDTSLSRDEYEAGISRRRMDISLRTLTSINARYRLALTGLYNSYDESRSMTFLGDFSGRNEKGDLSYNLSGQFYKQESSDSYQISGMVTKVRLLPKNTVLNYSLGGFYNTTAGEESFGATGSVNLSKPLSRVVGMNIGANATVGETGTNALRIRFTERPSKRMSFSQSYELTHRYGSEFSGDQQGLTHHVSATADMFLHRRLSTSLYLGYTVNTTEGFMGGLSVGTWFWRLALTSGISLSKTKSESEDVTSYETFLNVRGSFWRGMSMSVDARYREENDSEKRKMMLLRPYMTYQWRMLSMRFEYEWRKDETESGETTSQRIYVSVTRPFWRVFAR